jgi:hypothetical protein
VISQWGFCPDKFFNSQSHMMKNKASNSYQTGFTRFELLEKESILPKALTELKRIS